MAMETALFGAVGIAVVGHYAKRLLPRLLVPCIRPLE